MKKKSDKKRDIALMERAAAKATADAMKAGVAAINRICARLELIGSMIDKIGSSEKAALIVIDLKHALVDIEKWKGIAAQLEMDKQRLIKQIVGTGNGSSANASGNEAPGSPTDPGTAGVPDSEHPSA